MSDNQPPLVRLINTKVDPEGGCRTTWAFSGLATRALQAVCRPGEEPVEALVRLMFAMVSQSTMFEDETVWPSAERALPVEHGMLAASEAHTLSHAVAFIAPPADTPSLVQALGVLEREQTLLSKPDPTPAAIAAAARTLSRLAPEDAERVLWWLRGVQDGAFLPIDDGDAAEPEGWAPEIVAEGPPEARRQGRTRRGGSGRRARGQEREGGP